MTDKVVSIGPYQLGALAAFTEVLNIDELRQHLPPFDGTSLFYSCMLQSGATRFELCKVERNRLPNSEFLKKRISFFSLDEYTRTLLLIRSVFAQYLPESYRSDNKYDAVVKLEYFLTDLCFAMGQKTSMVSVLSMPQIDELRHLLSPELFLPIKGLMSALEPDELVIPVPKVAVAKSNVEIFLQLLKSDLFRSFSSAQVDLDVSSIAKGNAIARITNTANELVRHNLRIVSLKSTTISLLPITAKLIDVVFGRLPGVAAEYSTKLLSALMNEKRRIVIYQFNPVFHEVIETRFRSAFNKQLSEFS